MEKINLKKILPIIIILLFIMIIIIGVIIVSLKKQNDQISNIDPNGDLITIINEDNNENTLYIDTENNVAKNNQKVYQDLNGKNYQENNKDNKTFRIQDVIHNSDGTITLKGRVYKYLELPSYLSAEEYKALLEGKSINILGEKATMIQDETKADEAGYDIAIKVESKKYNYNFYYYATEDEEAGIAELYNGSDSFIAEGTDIYLQITLNGDFECSYFGEKIALKDYYKNDVHIADVDKTRLLHRNDEFIINDEDGSILYLVVTGR